MKFYTVEEVKNGAIDDVLLELYGAEEIKAQTGRYVSLLKNASDKFGIDKAALFSSPGRSELCGNHTDHNRGRVIAAGIQLDKISAVMPRSDSIVEIVTEGFSHNIQTDLQYLKPDSDESGKADALVKGVAAYFREHGFQIGGFSAYIESLVAMGSGLSSSAAFEVLIGMIFNTLYNQDEISAVELAKAGKYAENTYFHKPCGLMDQLACAVGGIAIIDFEDEESPEIECLDFNFHEHDYQLMILDTGGNHANLTGEYASIPREMGCIARELGGNVLRDSSLDQLMRRSSHLRRTCGDRAFLRALHFFLENERVSLVREAIRYNDMTGYLRLIDESGRSSQMFLQNCVPTGAVENQAVNFALGLLKTICPKGVFRIHGGGFAGTIQGYIPADSFDTMQIQMEEHFGRGSATPLSIRSFGVIHIG